MLKTLKTEAIVLKKRNLLGKDVLISLFTETDGKIIAVAKGLRKITSKRSPHLQTGNLIKIQLNRKKDRSYLEETSLISGFSEIKKDERKINILYQFFFVLDRLLPENQKENTVYQLTKSFLIKLSQKTLNNNILSIYLNKVLKALGYLKKDYTIEKLKKIIFDLINEKMPFFDI